MGYEKYMNVRYQYKHDHIIATTYDQEDIVTSIDTAFLNQQQQVYNITLAPIGYGYRFVNKLTHNSEGYLVKSHVSLPPRDTEFFNEFIWKEGNLVSGIKTYKDKDKDTNRPSVKGTTEYHSYKNNTNIDLSYLYVYSPIHSEVLVAEPFSLINITGRRTTNLVKQTTYNFIDNGEEDDSVTTNYDMKFDSDNHYIQILIEDDRNHINIADIKYEYIYCK